METRITRLFGINHPVIAGGMVWFSTSSLVSAVSNAGGLGLLAGGSNTPQSLRDEIKRTRELTTMPFGVNIPLIYPQSEELVKACLDEKVPVVFTSAGSPKKYTKTLKDSGAKVAHVVPSAALAKKAEEAGVDAVVAEGFESGGHVSFDEVTTLVLVPRVADTVTIPVIAAGGIADVRGFVAALSLGAEGIQMGTRFIASKECKGHPKFQELVLKATETSTVITGRRFGPTRVIKNKLADEILEMEKNSATNEEILEFLGSGRSRMASVDGDIEMGTVQCGQVAGLVSELKSVKEIIEGIVNDAGKIVARIDKLAGS